MAEKDDMLPVLQGDPEALGWLKNSIKQEIADARVAERRCRARAGSPTIVLASLVLADLHKAVADLVAAKLVALDAKGANT